MKGKRGRREGGREMAGQRYTGVPASAWFVVMLALCRTCGLNGE